jgi:hypothetical protein
MNAFWMHSLVVNPEVFLSKIVHILTAQMDLIDAIDLHNPRCFDSIQSHEYRRSVRNVKRWVSTTIYSTSRCKYLHQSCWVEARGKYTGPFAYGFCERAHDGRNSNPIRFHANAASFVGPKDLTNIR